MRKIFLIVLGFSLFANAQNKITFGYDDAGNQIKRELCLSCKGKSVVSPPKEIVALKEDDLQKFFPEDVISYYPNPVKEELFLKWELTNENQVIFIQVFLLGGQLLQTYYGLESNTSQTIPFQSYPSGVYIVVLNYKNGDPKSIKIIKQ